MLVVVLYKGRTEAAEVLVVVPVHKGRTEAGEVLVVVTVHKGRTEAAEVWSCHVGPCSSHTAGGVE